MARTADFRDANNNGVDDRDEGKQNRQEPSRYKSSPGAPGMQQMYGGMGFYTGMMQDLMGNGGTGSDDGRAAMRESFQFDAGTKFLNTQLGMAQSEFNLAQNKEGMSFANMLDRQTMQESRNHIHGLNMQNMDKTFALNDEFSNRQHSRDINTLGATGYQTRLNYQEQGQQDRLGKIVTGEQTRQNYAAEGDQTRKNYGALGIQNRAQARVEGQEQRLGYQELGVQNRAQARVEGEEQRLGYETQGKETRKNYAALGVENRLQAVTEGEQERLNIGETGNQNRKTLTHSDDILKARERGQQQRAKSAATSF